MTKSELIKVLNEVEGDPEITVMGAEVAVVVAVTEGDAVTHVTLDEQDEPFLDYEKDDGTLRADCKCLWPDE
jgi:hypothetical protein